jgi:SAM-dependent methyltransferase
MGGHVFLDGVALGLAFKVSNGLGIAVFIAILSHAFSDGLNTVSLLIKSGHWTKRAIALLGLDAIMRIASKHGLKVISDTAQAPGAFYRDKYAGTVAHVGGYSLNYHKHIHTGEGGILVTNDGKIAERLQLIRNHAEAVVAGKGVTNLSNMVGHNFRLGEIENLPVADSQVDVILSNCVINLSPDKQQVCREAFRVLAPGGRLAIRDVIATAPMPEALANDPRMVAGCVGAAAPVAELKAALLKAGFRSVDIDVDEASRAVIATWFPGSGAERYVASASITAKKAGACGCGPSGCG